MHTDRQKPEPGSLPDTLACVDESCDHTLKVKMHCGFPMHIEQKKAFDNFAIEKKVEILRLPTGQGIIFKP